MAPCVGGSISIGQILIISQPPSLLWPCCLLLSARYFLISNFHPFHIFLNQSLLFPTPPPVFGLVAPCLRRPHDRAAISPVVSTSTCVPHQLQYHKHTYHTVTIPHTQQPIVKIPHTHQPIGTIPQTYIPIDTITHVHLPHSHNTTHTTHRHKRHYTTERNTAQHNATQHKK